MKNSERKPKYAMRKLSVGLVSCMLGFALIAGPSHSLAAGGGKWWRRSSRRSRRRTWRYSNRARKWWGTR